MELQWPLILFTTFIAWSAGLFGTQGIMALIKGPDGKRGVGRKAQMPAVWVSAILLAIGGIAVFFHLQHWERIFNGFGHITSGITQELIAIVIFAIVAVIFFIMLRRAEVKGTVPVWVAICAIVISVVLAFVCGHSYMMESRPAWDTLLEVLSVMGAACILGPATMAFIMAVRGDDCTPAGKPVLIGAIIGAVLVLIYAIYLQTSGGSYVDVGYYYDPTSPTEGMTDVTGAIADIAPLLWIGGFVVGGVLPVIFAIIAKIKNKPILWKIMSLLIVICGFAGAIVLRMAFYELGFSIFLLF